MAARIATPTNFEPGCGGVHGVLVSCCAAEANSMSVSKEPAEACTVDADHLDEKFVVSHPDHLLRRGGIIDYDVVAVTVAKALRPPSTRALSLHTHVLLPEAVRPEA